MHPHFPSLRLFVSLYIVCLAPAYSYCNSVPRWSKIHTKENAIRDRKFYLNGWLDAFSPKSKQIKETENIDVLIVGAGIAGLSCSKSLLDAGMENFKILESSDRPGGRVQTDEVDGFLLDRGFQVFLENYPEARKAFDYPSLELKQFLPGALVRLDGSYNLVSDPIRRPADLIPTLLSPIGSIADKIRIGLYSVLIRFEGLNSIYNKKEVTTAEYLSEVQGLSSDMIDRFFSPFYQGIFLSPLSVQSSRMFEFVFKMFTEGAASIPRNGMREIPLQLASRLSEDQLALNTRVSSIKKGSDDMFTVKATQSSDAKSGKSKFVKNKVYSCKTVVIAADPVGSKALLDSIISGSNEKSNGRSTIEKDPVAECMDIPVARSSICLYYGFEGAPPVEDPLLILNGENKLNVGFDQTSDSTINNICFPSQVSPAYAPEGKSLASVTIIGNVGPSSTNLEKSDELLEQDVRAQLGEWFGVDTVEAWKFLRIYRIPYAQPAQTPPGGVGTDMVGGKIVSGAAAARQSTQVAEGLFVCGDHRDTATLNGAIASGARAGAQVLLDL